MPAASARFTDLQYATQEQVHCRALSQPGALRGSKGTKGIQSKMCNSSGPRAPRPQGLARMLPIRMWVWLKNRCQNGTLLSGNVDQNLRNPSCLILSHTHVLPREIFRLGQAHWPLSPDGATAGSAHLRPWQLGALPWQLGYELAPASKAMGRTCGLLFGKCLILELRHLQLHWLTAGVAHLMARVSAAQVHIKSR